MAVTRFNPYEFLVLRDKKTRGWSLMPRWMTPEFVTFSGEFVMHKSINVFESGVTRVGSVINWLRPYISKMFIRWEGICFSGFAAPQWLHCDAAEPLQSTLFKSGPVSYGLAFRVPFFSNQASHKLCCLSLMLFYSFQWSLRSSVISFDTKLRDKSPSASRSKLSCKSNNNKKRHALRTRGKAVRQRFIPYCQLRCVLTSRRFKVSLRNT